MIYFLDFLLILREGKNNEAPSISDETIFQWSLVPFQHQEIEFWFYASCFWIVAFLLIYLDGFCEAHIF